MDLFPFSSFYLYSSNSVHVISILISGKRQMLVLVYLRLNFQSLSPCCQKWNTTRTGHVSTCQIRVPWQQSYVLSLSYIATEHLSILFQSMEHLWWWMVTLWCGAFYRNTLQTLQLCSFNLIVHITILFYFLLFFERVGVGQQLLLSSSQSMNCPLV